MASTKHGVRPVLSDAPASEITLLVHLLQPCSHVHFKRMIKVHSTLGMCQSLLPVVTIACCSQSCDVEASRTVIHSAVDPDP